MIELYESVGQYITTCFTNRDSLDVLIKELSPLVVQVNYRALSIDNIDQITESLGLGDQAITIVSNIVIIFQTTTSGNTRTLLANAGLDKKLIETLVTDITYDWVTAGIILLGSGIISSLRVQLNDKQERSDTD